MIFFKFSVFFKYSIVEVIATELQIGIEKATLQKEVSNRHASNKDKLTGGSRKVLIAFGDPQSTKSFDVLAILAACIAIFSSPFYSSFPNSTIVRCSVFFPSQTDFD